MYSKLVLCTAALFVYFDSLSTSTTIPSFLKLVLCQFPKLCTVCTVPYKVAYKFDVQNYCTVQMFFDDQMNLFAHSQNL